MSQRDGLTQKIKINKSFISTVLIALKTDQLIQNGLVHSSRKMRISKLSVLKKMET